eukprot:g37707.t1
MLTSLNFLLACGAGSSNAPPATRASSASSGLFRTMAPARQRLQLDWDLWPHGGLACQHSQGFLVAVGPEQGILALAWSQQRQPTTPGAGTPVASSGRQRKQELPACGYGRPDVGTSGREVLRSEKVSYLLQYSQPLTWPSSYSISMAGPVQFLVN